MISIENAREQLMNSILSLNTANDLDRIHGARAISWMDHMVGSQLQHMHS